jgi:hypothetical protein
MEPEPMISVHELRKLADRYRCLAVAIDDERGRDVLAKMSRECYDQARQIETGASKPG